MIQQQVSKIWKGSQVLHEGIDRGVFLVIDGLDGCANRVIIKEMPLR